MKATLLVALMVGATVMAGCGDKGPKIECDEPAKADLAPRNASNPVALWKTTQGCFAAELYVDDTPITAGNFRNLTDSGFYDGTRFHRVIGPAKYPSDPLGFMIQDGDPNSKDRAKSAQWGGGGPGYSIRDEFPCNDGTTSYQLPADCAEHGGLKYVHDTPGLLSMANRGPGTGGSQYFVTLGTPEHLDGRHPIFGKVIFGMDVVVRIGNVETDAGDRPTTDVVIGELKLL